MEESLRRQYLEAMGIQNWVGRESAPEPIAVPVSTPDAAPVSVEPDPSLGEAMPTQERVPPSSPVDVVTQPPEIAPVHDVMDLGWDDLSAKVKTCQACGLHETRTQTVFGVGKQDADLLIVGEAPGPDEDHQGEAFVGSSERLFNAMMKAIGLDRNQVFLTNIIKCCTPENRDPHVDEVRNCDPFLQRQIELIKPKVILAVGRVAAHNLLKSGVAVAALRKQEHLIGETGIPLVVTYHPGYLLRAPEHKAEAWRDLQKVSRLL